MCTPNHNSLLTYGLKVPAPAPYFPLNPATSPLSALDLHRSQLCEYNARVQLSLRGYTHALTGLSPYHGAYLADPYTHYLYKGDPRARFVQEEPKPSHSYIGLIAMAILSSKEKKLVLSDIYQWILDNYPYFRTRGPGWRNSIRHNLSLNDCFIKAGRSANGKGHYWAVHPANVDDFTRGDFRRRRAQRKVRKHMGLSVPDDDDDSPSPSPNPISWMHNGQDSGKGQADHEDSTGQEEGDADEGELDPGSPGFEERHSSQTPGQHFVSVPTCGMAVPHVSKKRLFDVESLLAPDLPVVVMPKVRLLPSTVPSSHQTTHVGPFQSSSCVAGDDGAVSEDSDVDIETEDVPISDSITLSPDSHRARQQDAGDTTSPQDVLTEMGDEDEPRDDTRATPTSTSTPTATMAPLPACTATTALDLSSSACTPSKLLLSQSQVGQAGLPHPLIVASSAEGHRLIGRRPLGGMDLGSGRYSAFQATGPGALRTSLPPSVVPFLHPVLAVSRYPTLLPPTLTKPAHLPERVDSLPRPCTEEASVDPDKI